MINFTRILLIKRGILEVNVPNRSKYSVAQIFKMWSFIKALIFMILIIHGDATFRSRVEKSQCPTVRSVKSFDFHQILGNWYVIRYFASSEESEIYRCMRTNFRLSPNEIEISMNFTFSFMDDPDNEQLYGNITWKIPDLKRPSHWIHSESTYEGVYNTYVLDVNMDENKSWVLLLHCAEKSGTARYLSSFIMSRRSTLPNNVVSYLQEKLPQYDIDLQYLFQMQQKECTPSQTPLFIETVKTLGNKHPMKHPGH